MDRLGLERTLEGHQGCVNCLQWSSNGEILASGSDDVKVILWNPLSGKKKVEIHTGHKGNIFSVKVRDHPQMTSRKFVNVLTSRRRRPLCHTKMGILLALPNMEWQKCEPPPPTYELYFMIAPEVLSAKNKLLLFLVIAGPYLLSFSRADILVQWNNEIWMSEIGKAHVRNSACSGLKISKKSVRTSNCKSVRTSICSAWAFKAQLSENQT